MANTSLHTQQLDSIFRHFPDLDDEKISQLEKLGPLYDDWNSKINVISRKDIGNLYLHHILHSLAIARVVNFKPGTRILDAGTGGGLPGIPLAILFPEAQFHLVDSVGKKIKVVQAITQALGLKNVTSEQSRMETLKNKFDFVTSRAVTKLPPFYHAVKNKIKSNSKHDLFNGILYLKGGNIDDEMENSGLNYALYPIDSYFQEPYFQEKFVVYIPVD